MSTPTLSAPLDAYDRQLVKFALAWTPYGGPPDDLAYLEFGTTPGGVDERFRSVVAHYADRSALLTRADRTLITSAVAALAGRK